MLGNNARLASVLGLEVEGADENLIFPEEEASKELTDLEKAHAERDRMRDQLLRIAADFDNFRKR